MKTIMNTISVVWLSMVLIACGESQGTVTMDFSEVFAQSISPQVDRVTVTVKGPQIGTLVYEVDVTNPVFELTTTSGPLTFEAVGESMIDGDSNSDAATDADSSTDLDARTDGDGSSDTDAQSDSEIDSEPYYVATFYGEQRALVPANGEVDVLIPMYPAGTIDVEILIDDMVIPLQAIVTFELQNPQYDDQGTIYDVRLEAGHLKRVLPVGDYTFQAQLDIKGGSSFKAVGPESVVITIEQGYVYYELLDLTDI